MNSKLTKWDKRFMEQAKFVSEWSKDKNTKTGAVVVDEENTELVMGYNGFARGANDDDYPSRYERPDKYFWTEHAERNAIYKAARLGISLKNTKMYCTYFPCADCTRAIIQAGIKQLYTEKPDFNHHKWGESWVEAMTMLKECNVEVIWTNVEDEEVVDDGKCCDCGKDRNWCAKNGYHTTSKHRCANCLEDYLEK